MLVILIDEDFRDQSMGYHLDRWKDLLQELNLPSNTTCVDLNVTVIESHVGNDDRACQTCGTVIEFGQWFDNKGLCDTCVKVIQ